MEKQKAGSLRSFLMAPNSPSFPKIPSNPNALSTNSGASPFHFSFNLDHKNGEGEDADPVLFRDFEGRWLAGVFDGMGGRGSRKYKDKTSGEVHSGAYFASRLIAQCFREEFDAAFLSERPPSLPQSPDGLEIGENDVNKQSEYRLGEDEVDEVSTNPLGTEMKVEGVASGSPDGLGYDEARANNLSLSPFESGQALVPSVGESAVLTETAPTFREDVPHEEPLARNQPRNAEVAPFPPKLKERAIDLSHEYMTQKIHHRLNARCEELSPLEGAEVMKSKLASVLPTTLCCVFAKQRDNGVEILAWNVGDSRAYVLEPVRGLRLITKDDIVVDLDPLQSLLSDPPLSQYVAKDGKFQIKEFNAFLPLPGIVIVATDGCFGYVRSPMDFEHLLLRTMVGSDSEEDWKNRISSELRGFAADDCSMAALAFGFNSFDELKAQFKKRLDLLIKDFVAPLNDLELDYQGDERELDTAKLKAEASLKAYERKREELWVWYNK